jgi:hypothetical protein
MLVGGKLIQISTPICAIEVSAILRSTPGMVSRSSTLSEKGAIHPLDLGAKISDLDSSR